jgi:lipopolysaccharide transport system ATP-binding protein
VLRTTPLLLVADLYTTTIAVREREVQIAAQLGTNFHVRHPTLQTFGYGVYHQPGEWTLKPAAPAAAPKQSEFAK